MGRQFVYKFVLWVANYQTLRTTYRISRQVFLKSTYDQVNMAHFRIVTYLKYFYFCQGFVQIWQINWTYPILIKNDMLNVWESEGFTKI